MRKTRKGSARKKTNAPDKSAAKKSTVVSPDIERSRGGIGRKNELQNGETKGKSGGRIVSGAASKKERVKGRWTGGSMEHRGLRAGGHAA